MTLKQYDDLEFVMDKKNLSLKTHSFKTLPKAQRTRGLSSSCQSHIASLTKILIEFHLQNLDSAAEISTKHQHLH